jgi:hypothetical protein
MTGLVLTTPSPIGGGDIANAFETLILDSGTLVASGADTLNITGGTAINVTGGGSPKTVTIDFIPSDILLNDLGDVNTTGVSDGYVLVYRAGSPSEWVAEPSTTTDEFVRASATDTTTGHLNAKLSDGTGISFTTLNPSGNEQIEISLNAVLDDLTNVSVPAPSTGHVLSWTGSAWEAVDPSFIDTTLTLAAGPGINIDVAGSPVVSTISMNVCSLPAGTGSPTTLDLSDSVAVCDGTNTFRYTIQEIGDVLNITTNLDIFSDTREPTGHLSRDESAVLFNPATRTFTITPVGTSFRYYIHGVSYDITTPKSIVIPNTTATYYIYFDTDENLYYQTNFTEHLLMDYAYTAAIHWNATPATGAVGFVYQADERHGITMDGQTHAHLHYSFGTQYISGLALSGLNPDVGAPTDGDVQFAVESGWIRDEDLAFYIRDDSTPAVHSFDLVQNLNPIAQIPVLFRDSGGDEWNKANSSGFPLIYSDGVVFTGASGLPPYNAESGGSWTLQEVANNSYFLVHYLATNDPNNPIVAIQGLTNYNNRPAGQAQAEEEMKQVSGLPFEEFVPIATIIFEARTAYGNTPSVRAVTTSDGDDYVDWRSTTLLGGGGGGGAGDHGSLSGLTDDDHPQYTTNAYDSVTDGTTTVNATGRDNAIEFIGEDGINVTVGAGSPETATISIGFESGLQMSIINGQPILTFIDDTRGGAGKRLSVAEQSLVFSENQLTANDWLDIGSTVDADSGYIADFAGTVVFATAHCENTAANIKNIHLFINNVDQGSIGTLAGGLNATFINTTIDIDFTRGDKIRLQAQQGSGGAIEDTVVKLSIKWRG